MIKGENALRLFAPFINNNIYSLNQFSKGSATHIPMKMLLIVEKLNFYSTVK